MAVDEIERVRTSLRMTRVISDEIGYSLEEILQQIYNVFDSETKEEEEKINLSYSQWQFLITQLFHDEILIMALNKTILVARDECIDLNRSKTFLDYVTERIVSEFKTEIKKTQHPIALLSLMNRVGGKKKREQAVKTGVDAKW
jgi:hypothetical protein